jgi:hypothetical protein
MYSEVSICIRKVTNDVPKMLFDDNDLRELSAPSISSKKVLTYDHDLIKVGQHLKTFMRTSRRFLKFTMRSVAIGVATFQGLLCQSNAQIFLANGDSTALIDPTSQAGMYHWDVLGLNQLHQQWFWYGVGAAPVRSIDTISAPLVTPIGPNEATIAYVNPGNYSVSVDYLLTGGTLVGPQVNADLGESIKIVNLSAAVLPFHFYQYSYFNLMGASSDTVQLGTNLRGQYNEALQFNGNVALTETVTTPGAGNGEVAPLGATLAKLNGGGPVTLGPPFFAGPLGPGAVTWALEWDLSIAPGASVLISKDKYLQVTVIPEPSALALISLGAVAFALRNRRRAA